MTPVELSRTVLQAVRRAVDDGELDVAVPERVVVTEPGPGGCGDFATAIALQLARPAGQPPLRVAEILRDRLVGAAGVRDVVVTGPGFLNITLDEQADPVTGLVREIRAQGSRYGHGDALAGQVVALRVPYEVRAEVVADAVVRIVGTQGGRATVEHGEPVNLRPVPAPEDPAPLGADAAQWALLHPAPHDRPRITADHLVQRESNPLFRVRYAHARIRSLSRNAARLGFAAEPGSVVAPQSADVPGSMVAPHSADVPGSMVAPHSADVSGSVVAPHSEDVPVPVVAPHSEDVPVPVVAPHSEYVPVPVVAPHSADVPGPLVAPPPADVPVLLMAPHPAAAPDAAPKPPLPTPTPLPLHHLPTPTPLPLHHLPTPRSPLAAVQPLLTPLADHPRILAAAATHRAPDRVARHLVTVADAVLPFLPCVLPCGEEKPSAAHRARLALAEAAGTVLAGGLSLLGIDAPEHL